MRGLTGSRNFSPFPSRFCARLMPLNSVWFGFACLMLVLRTLLATGAEVSGTVVDDTANFCASTISDACTCGFC